jgi:hypothetical protein
VPALSRQLVNLAVGLAQIADRERGELDVARLPRLDRGEALDLENDRRADVPAWNSPKLAVIVAAPPTYAPSPAHRDRLGLVAVEILERAVFERDLGVGERLGRLRG